VRELAVVGFCRVVRVLLDVVPRRETGSASTPGQAGAASVTTSLGIT
jgi:hypothetical protein